MMVVNDERCIEYSTLGHPERPARIIQTLALLRERTDPPLRWASPVPVKQALLARAHTPEHIQAISAAERDFDGDTPTYPKIFEHAKRSVGSALSAMQAARNGNAVFSLMRPPGHHATRNRAMGFCYLNNMAVTVLEARATGIDRVAVYDFDVHHGNGTEAILIDQAGTGVYSVHQYPCYPGTGTGNVGPNCHNYPVAPHTPRKAYRQALEIALANLARFKPELILVSAGFDAYARDPLAQGTLEAEDYHWLGQSIRHLGIPAFSLLEGGYSSDLPNLILAYLKGLGGE